MAECAHPGQNELSMRYTSVISRWDNSDYHCHAVDTLRRSLFNSSFPSDVPFPPLLILASRFAERSTMIGWSANSKIGRRTLSLITVLPRFQQAPAEHIEAVEISFIIGWPVA
ncbi:hypothetical protein A0H81_08382 [Grifola frondosa]|uniref:Uncharacterized protein n=1 Tax=Grifola frondosa TaxID=5627 RepID=A0A1C7M3E1_GRIFR|nr:hypothetical protein A0H81_08382 [Grifola frondosa]